MDSWSILRSCYFGRAEHLCLFLACDGGKEPSSGSSSMLVRATPSPGQEGLCSDSALSLRYCLLPFSFYFSHRLR